MKSNKMNMKQITTVMGWLMPRKEMLKQHTRKDLMRMIEAETGVHVNLTRLAEMEESVGVVRERGNMGGYRKDRAVVLALELIRVQEALGMEISDDLRDISERK